MADTQLALLLDRFMRRIHVALRAKAPQFDPERLGPANAMVLLTIADMGSAGLQDLTRRVARDKSQMTRVIGTLEERGMVARKAAPDDGRVSLISLTPKGEASVAMIRRAMAETIDEILLPIEDHEKTALKALLDRVVG